MLRKDRISWLENKKILGSKKLRGRKKFGVYKNQQSFMLGERDNNSVSPDLSVVYGRIERGEEMKNRGRSHIKLRPLDDKGIKKSLREKEVEIDKLTNLYKNVAERISAIERSHRSEVQFDLGKLWTDKMSSRALEVSPIRNRSEKQSIYTKMNPKIIITNPITGISSLKKF